MPTTPWQYPFPPTLPLPPTFSRPSSCSSSSSNNNNDNTTVPDTSRTMTAEGVVVASSPERGVKRDKSLALDDVFASRYFGGKSFDKTKKGGDGTRSVSGDMYKSKDKLRHKPQSNPENDESGADTDTGHSVATTGHHHRSHKRAVARKKRGVGQPHKAALHAFNTSGSQLINALYKNNNEDTEEEDDEENEASPEREAGAAKSHKKDSKSKYAATSSRSTRTAERKSRDPSPSKDQKERTRPSSRLNSQEDGEKSSRSGRARRERPISTANSPQKRTSGGHDRELQHHHHHHHHNHQPSATERHGKSEPQESREQQRRKREETHPTSPSTNVSSSVEPISKVRDAPRASGGPSKSVRKKSSDVSIDRSSSSRQHRPESSRSKIPPESPRSPSSKVSSGPKSGVRKARDKEQSPKEDSPTSITEHTDANLSSPRKARIKKVGPPSPQRSPNRVGNKMYSSPSRSGDSGTRGQMHLSPSRSVVDVSESEADDTLHARDLSSVLQFDPSQDDSVYRVRQVTGTQSTVTIANSDGTSVEGQIAEFIDPVGEAQQLQDQISGHPKEMPIFDFLESEEFDFPAPNPHAAASPLDLPSGGEEEDEYEAEDDLDAGIQCSQGSFHYGGEPKGLNESAFGFDDSYNEQPALDNGFGYGLEEPMDADNPYEYGIDYVSPHLAFDEFEPENDVDDQPYNFDGDELEWNRDGAAYDEHPLHSTAFDDSFQKSEPFGTSLQNDWSPTRNFVGNENRNDNVNNFGFDDDVQFGAPLNSSRTDLRCPSGGEEDGAKPSESRQDPENRSGVKKKRLVKVKVVKKSGAPDGSPSKQISSGPNVEETGKPRRPKVVKKKPKSSTPSTPKLPPRKQACDDAENSDEFSLDNVETTEQKKKHHHPPSSLLSAKSPATPSKALMAKLHDSFSKHSTANGNEESGGADNSRTGKATTPQGNSLSALTALPPKSPLRSQPKGGLSPANSTSSKKRPSVRLATSIGRYFSRSSRNFDGAGAGAGGGSGGADEGSISSNSRGSRGGVLFRGKTKQHQLLGDDSSYDSGNIQY